MLSVRTSRVPHRNTDEEGRSIHAVCETEREGRGEERREDEEKEGERKYERDGCWTDFFSFLNVSSLPHLLNLYGCVHLFSSLAALAQFVGSYSR